MAMFLSSCARWMARVETKESISGIVMKVMTQLRETLPQEQEERLAVFDSEGDSQGNMTRYNKAGLQWISRVPETSTEAKTALEQESTAWQAFADGSGQERACIRALPQGKERWVIFWTKAAEQAARLQMEKKVKQTKAQWHNKLWHLSNQQFACQDAHSAWNQALKGKPGFLGYYLLYHVAGLQLAWTPSFPFFL